MRKLVFPKSLTTSTITTSSRILFPSYKQPIAWIISVRASTQPGFLEQEVQLESGWLCGFPSGLPPAHKHEKVIIVME